MTKSAPSVFRAWFDLARAGNFPSVASNVLAAYVLSDVGSAPFERMGSIGVATVAGLLTYAGGATLNDVMDTAHDAEHRPERSIPSGRIARGTALGIALIELVAGLALFVMAGASVAAALGLGAAIVIYDSFHKGWTGSVFVIAGCRVLLALIVATLPGHAATASWAVWVVALFLYIASLSLLARRETTGGEAVRRVVGRLLSGIPLVDAAALLVVGHWGTAAVCAAAVAAGTAARRVAAST